MKKMWNLNLPKAVAAQKRLNSINSSVKVDAVIKDLNLDNAEELLAGFDVIIDGTDNFMTRYLINDVAVKYGIPWVHGAAVSSRGMFAVIKPGITPCYRCLFPKYPLAEAKLVIRLVFCHRLQISLVLFKQWK